MRSCCRVGVSGWVESERVATSKPKPHLVAGNAKFLLAAAKKQMGSLLKQKELPPPTTPRRNAKRADQLVSSFLIKSGYQDSNLGPPAPKAGALTGLRYIPLFLNCGAKVVKIFNVPNFFRTFFTFYCIFLDFCPKIILYSAQRTIFGA